MMCCEDLITVHIANVLGKYWMIFLYLVVTRSIQDGV